MFSDFNVSLVGLLSVYIYSKSAFHASAHGRLLEPPGRSSMWRFKEFAKYNPPENYNDNQLFCGGYSRQFRVNGGRCGPCGDPYDTPVPRENESGGKYGRGIIVRDYKVGQVLDVTIQLTASHRGYFQFRLCNYLDPNVVEKQPCFNQNVLQISPVGTGTKFPIQVARSRTELFNVSLQLPPNLRCRQCILQWHYRTGNSWGKCVNGTSGVGCGEQEVFRACSDISIQ